MKIVRVMSLLLAGGMAMTGYVPGAIVPQPPKPQEIAENTELVIPAIRDQAAGAAAAIVLQAQAAILATDWQAPRKRAQMIALITYAVAAKGKDAAPMMSIVVANTPPVWLAVIAASAIMAAGDSSPAVAKAMLAAVAGDPQAAGTCRAACSNPATVLTAGDLGVVRGIMLPTPSQVPAKAPPLPTIIRSAEKYPGQ